MVPKLIEVEMLLRGYQESQHQTFIHDANVSLGMRRGKNWGS